MKSELRNQSRPDKNNKSNKNNIRERGANKRVSESSQQARAPQRPAQVAAILEEVLTWEHPADQCVSRYFRQNRQMGGNDRAEISQAVFDVLRHLRRYRRDAQSGPGTLTLCLAWRGLSATMVRAQDRLPEDPPMRAWVQHCEQIDLQSLSFAVRYSLPDWLVEQIQLLEQPETLAQSLLKQAPVDLRVNTFKSNRDEVFAQLQALFDKNSSFGASLTPYSSSGIRLKGNPPLERWPLFRDGFIEVQDEGSQLLAQLVDPRRQEMVIDYCAGAGGKTLALGAMMSSTGRLYAFDVSQARLTRAKPRFARSGLSNIHPVVIRPKGDDRIRRLARKAHRVLVDAPCTGVGTLRRNPDLKWRQTPESLAHLVRQQQDILRQASQCVRPGGRLVYATCSWLPQENEEQVQTFLQANPQFHLLDARELLPQSLMQTDVPTVDALGMVRLRPDVHGTDSFFAAVMQRDESV